MNITLIIFGVRLVFIYFLFEGMSPVRRAESEGQGAESIGRRASRVSVLVSRVSVKTMIE